MATAESQTLRAWDAAVAALRAWDMDGHDLAEWFAGYHRYLRACAALPSTMRLPWGVATGL